jgi:hypothetical protein
MCRYAILPVVCLLAGCGTALAQLAQIETPPAPSAPAPADQAGPPVTMEEPLPGDHWTYEVRDEILGAVKSTRTSVITEVTATEISTRFSFVGNSNLGSAVFDRSWNITNRAGWRYKPHDGTGVRLPLVVGNIWSFKSNDVNSINGASWSRSGSSKVVGQESVSTKAGTFDTFKIETSYSTRNVNNPTRMAQVTLLTWYAPSIDHWVKRTYTSRVVGRLTENNSDVLIEYGRKP